MAPATVTAQGGKKATAVQTAAALPALPIQLPPAFGESLNAPIRRAEFSQENGIRGAQVFANLCKDEGLAALFCCPGNYTVINALAEVGVPCYGGRAEGSMVAAEDGFSLVTGEVTASSGTAGTEGPGFAHMIMDIAAARFASTPLLILASNMRLAQEDSQRGMQFLMQQPITENIRKWAKRITQPSRIFEYGAYAFRNLKSGVPGVVHLDFPGEVAGAVHRSVEA
jgi:thiamine pyrophosphate-dependent acetolactate synthase large subunit-like protein